MKNGKHGIHSPLARHPIGGTGINTWVRATVDFRSANGKTNGHEPMASFPPQSRKWERDIASPEPYSSASRKLALLSAPRGDKGGESYTLHPPKNLFAKETKK